MTGTDLCVHKPYMSRSYLNHLVLTPLSRNKTVSDHQQRASDDMITTYTKKCAAYIYICGTGNMFRYQAIIACSHSERRRAWPPPQREQSATRSGKEVRVFNPYPTAFPYGNGMVLHFYQQQESSTTKTVHKVINKGLKAYV